MGFIKNPFSNRQPGGQARNATPAPAVSSSTYSKNGVTLASNDPDTAMKNVATRMERVTFGWSYATRWMENYSEVWSWLGPIILVVGTIVEVGFVLYERQRIKDFWSLISIVAVAMVMEGTFLTVSYKAALIRNRGEKRQGGPTDLDRKKFRRLVPFWFALAVGVCATQVIFIVAQTNSSIPGQGGDIGTTGLWIFAIMRALFTCVADGYTAFAHEEKPTTAEQEQERIEQETAATEKFLTLENKKIAIVNAGTLQVRETAIEAAIKEDKLNTRLEAERMLNDSQLEALATQSRTSQLATTMMTNLMSALLDPETPADKRQAAFMIANAIGKGYNQMEAKNKTSVREIEEP